MNRSMQQQKRLPTSRPRRGWLVVDILLGFMAAGPILAPLFRASRLPLFTPVGEAITALGFWICPQPEMAFQLAGYPWAVCSRCYTALLGIMALRVAYARRGATFAFMERRSWALRLLLAVVTFGLWQLDVHAMHHGWWNGGQPTMILTGLWLGLGAGMAILAALHRLIEPSPARAAADAAL